MLKEFLEKAKQFSDHNIFVTVDENWLEKHAAQQATKSGLLAGKLVAVKDNMNVKGLPQTCGSKFLENYIAPYNATVIEKLIDAGAIIAGKTNMDEFAMGSSSEYSAYGAVKNPVDTAYVPGGSSGGSAAAVAAGLLDYALGSDTGGSIRQPAAYTGTVGLKPSYGRVSRYGLTAFASSFDQIGPITKTVKQSAELLEVISGYDPKDSTSVDKPVENYSANLESLDKNMKIGVPFSLLKEGLDADVEKAFKQSVDTLKSRGFEIIDIDLPHSKYAIAVYYILATAEASSNLARFDGVRYGKRSSKNYKDLMDFYSQNREEGFGEEVKRRIMLGTYVLSSGYYDAYYKKAQKVRRLIFNDFQDSFSKVDVILTPTTPSTAFRSGEKVNDPLQMYLNDVFTVAINIAGLPALSIPLSSAEAKMPVGLQLIGNLFQEGTLLKLGHFIENDT